MTKRSKLKAMALSITCLLTIQTAHVAANEVGKGQIPEAQLESSYKKLDWGVSIWDTKEAVASLKSSEKALWVDTRPASFFAKGTVAGAVNLSYNKAGMEENSLTPESLTAALKNASLSGNSDKIVFFCQGPKCHRSYNASHAAVTSWGYKADNIIWFREGYPYLFKEVKENAKLKRKAAKYISEAGVKEL